MINRNLPEPEYKDLAAEEDIDFEISFYEDVIRDSPDLDSIRQDKRYQELLLKFRKK